MLRSVLSLLGFKCVWSFVRKSNVSMNHGKGNKVLGWVDEELEYSPISEFGEAHHRGLGQITWAMRPGKKFRNNVAGRRSQSPHGLCGRELSANNDLEQQEEYGGGCVEWAIEALWSVSRALWDVVQGCRSTQGTQDANSKCEEGFFGHRVEECSELRESQNELLRWDRPSLFWQSVIWTHWRELGSICRKVQGKGCSWMSESLWDIWVPVDV